MIKDKRVIAWTPYGRQETVSILGQYMRREHERGIVDEWWLCLNTDPGQADDLRYAYLLAAAHPDWIKIKDRPDGRPRRHPKQRNTGYFYEYMTDRDTVFVRFDDDIIYVHEEAIPRLVTHRIEHGAGVASFPVMWNNSIISWYAQQSGAIPLAGEPDLTDVSGLGKGTELADCYVWPKVGGPYCMDPVGWADGRFAVAIHRLLLTAVENNAAHLLFLYQDFPVKIGMQFSVSVFASLGSMYADLPEPGVLVPYEEEHWHTVHQPSKLAEPNIIVGDALVSHYSFFPQRAIIQGTDILDRYRAVAAKATAS
jgi:hypothetical protein